MKKQIFSVTIILFILVFFSCSNSIEDISSKNEDSVTVTLNLNGSSDERTLSPINNIEKVTKWEIAFESAIKNYNYTYDLSDDKEDFSVTLPATTYKVTAKGSYFGDDKKEYFLSGSNEIKISKAQPVIQLYVSAQKTTNGKGGLYYLMHEYDSAGTTEETVVMQMILVNMNDNEKVINIGMVKEDSVSYSFEENDIPSGYYYFYFTDGSNKYTLKDNILEIADGITTTGSFDENDFIDRSKIYFATSEDTSELNNNGLTPFSRLNINDVYKLIENDELVNDFEIYYDSDISEINLDSFITLNEIVKNCYIKIHNASGVVISITYENQEIVNINISNPNTSESASSFTFVGGEKKEIKNLYTSNINIILENGAYINNDYMNNLSIELDTPEYYIDNPYLIIKGSYSSNSSNVSVKNENYESFVQMDNDADSPNYKFYVQKFDEANLKEDSTITCKLVEEEVTSIQYGSQDMYTFTSSNADTNCKWYISLNGCNLKLADNTFNLNCIDFSLDKLTSASMIICCVYSDNTYSSTSIDITPDTSNGTNLAVWSGSEFSLVDDELNAISSFSNYSDVTSFCFDPVTNDLYFFNLDTKIDVYKMQFGGTYSSTYDTYWTGDSPFEGNISRITSYNGIVYVLTSQGTINVYKDGIWNLIFSNSSEETRYAEAILATNDGFYWAYRDSSDSIFKVQKNVLTTDADGTLTFESSSEPIGISSSEVFTSGIAIKNFEITDMQLINDNLYVLAKDELYSMDYTTSESTNTCRGAIVEISVSNNSILDIYCWNSESTNTPENDAEYLWAPKRFIALKPKKLVIAEEGFYGSTAEESASYGDINNVVVFDLENKSIQRTKTKKTFSTTYYWDTTDGCGIKN